MSWSVSFIGKPDKVSEALLEYSTKLSGMSKDEYDAAVNALILLVSQNFGNDAVMIKVSASGSGYRNDSTGTDQRSCNVSIENIYGILV